MNTNSVPPISMKNIKKHQKQERTKQIIWDNALEDLLSQPISLDLESKQVTWKKSTKMYSKSIPININSAFNIEDTERSQPPSIEKPPRARNYETKTREIMIRNIIQTPITPRKKYKLPQSGSTDTRSRAKTCLYDKHEVETIMFTRNQRPQPIAHNPVRKIEHASLTRAFDVHIPSSVRSMMKSRNSYFC